jgi:unsaturated chondroitin disaccharide hydrolase
VAVVTAWAVGALGRVLHRVESTLSTVDGRFPLYADPSTGAWRTTGRGSWAGGCWVGLLWLRARVTGSATHGRQAEDWARRLASWVDADTAVRGLILWYGAAAGVRLGLSEVGEAIALRGTHALCGSFHDQARVLPWGSAFGEGEVSVRARVDGVAGAVPLLAWSATRDASDASESRAVRVAAENLRQHLRLCRTDGDIVPAWTWHGRAWIPADEPPRGWSRGLAWLMLAAADATVWLGPEFEQPAHGLAQRWLLRCSPQRVPVAVHGQPSGPVDTSAAAIAALALLKLGYHREGSELLRALVANHLTDGSDRRPAGMLLDGCYDLARDVAIRHELVWGDYFLALGLATVAGVIPADVL